MPFVLLGSDLIALNSSSAETYSIEAEVDRLFASGRLDLAIGLLERLKKKEPGEHRHHLNLAFALLEARRPQDALRSIESAPPTSSTLPLFWLARGLAFLGLDEPLRAAAEFEQAWLRDHSLDIALLFQARAHLDCGDRLSVERTLSRLSPDLKASAEDVAEWAAVLIGIHEFDRASAVVSKALAVSPAHPRLLTLFAELQERAGNLAAAKSALDHVPQLDPAGELLSARLSARTGNVRDAIETLRRLQHRPDTSNSEQAAIAFELGKWLDRFGDHAKAWEAFEVGNSLDLERLKKNFPEGWKEQAHSERFEDPLALDSVIVDARARMHNSARSGRPAPVFLVGFPRSGTTLLDQFLGAHPSICVFEEQPLLDRAMFDLLKDTTDVVEAISGLDESGVQRLRELFWEDVDRRDSRASGACVVDKNPFNLLRVHFILRLFPDTKWLFALRHPLDSILSCFMQRFAFTEVTRGFHRIDEIARVYRRSTELWLAQRRRLNLKCIDVRYESVVTSPEASLRPVFELLQLPWNASVLEHRGTTGRWISTPSYDQVARPLYSSSVERWRHYAPQLQPAIEVLGDLITELGYSVTDSGLSLSTSNARFE